MFCPSCGANNSTEQRFCRSCGLNLEKSAESIFEQLPDARSAALLKREQRLEKFGDFAWNSFALVILLSVGAMVYHIYTGAQVWFEALILAFIFFGMLAVLHGGLVKALEQKKKRRNETLNGSFSGEIDGAEVTPKGHCDGRPAASLEDATMPLLTEKITKRLG